MEKKKLKPLILVSAAITLFLAAGVVCVSLAGAPSAAGADALDIGADRAAKIIPVGPGGFDPEDPDPEPPKFITIKERNPGYDTITNTVNALTAPLWIFFSLSVAVFIAATVLGILQKKGVLFKDAPKKES